MASNSTGKPTNRGKNAVSRPRDSAGHFLPNPSGTVREDFEEGRALDDVHQTLAGLATENFKLSEDMANLELMVDARGWSSIYEYDKDGGMSLRQIRLASNQLRELVAANGLIKRGSQVRNLYVWAGGLEIVSERPAAAGKPPRAGKLTAKIDELISSTPWQRYIFESDATEALERACYTDGNVFILGNDRTKSVMRVPLSQITADYRNPDNPEEVWAYRRSWTRNPFEDDPIYQVRWIYTDIYTGTRASSINVNGTQEATDTRSTIIDLGVNRQVGWAYGVPDALAALAWAKLYKEFMVNGYVMSRALAQFAYKVTVASKSAGSAAAMAVARPGDSGSSYIAGTGNDLTPMANAGKGYDFSAGAPLAAMVAAALDISTSDLLDPVSTDNEQNFSAPGRAMAALRRKTWDSFFRRLLTWAGESKKVTTQWHDLPDAQIQRILQAYTLANATGYFPAETIQKGMAEALQIADPGALPEGYLLPNNANSAARADLNKGIDNNPADPPGGTKDDPGVTGAGGATAGSGQGQSGPAGSLGNDHKTDTPPPKKK